MIGVVLWSDNSAGKAVFWCEDQGDLAYYEVPAARVGGSAEFDTGDLVQFNVSVHRKLRIADTPQLVQGRAGTHLPEALRNDGKTTATRDAPDTPHMTAQIIPFIKKAGPHRLRAAQQ
ncbi:hypothetical protein DSM14862_01250 [Sulfitobacter indolifex]|uniref:Uncharacterized protein n=1 Tax=Sulfitobacter indolifex HEL-45 TaxID=391624 RepID=A0ABM9X3P5_9RHOB|nr:hypothetical protein [Sulfitobacter indolifex]EDQ04025.1 hypothetical protein OIHEL45_11845 [Sulfitobacter indolifex HEL-45]UOA18481.1 hypothetical protein DSM14862_01250 [Sulfitobacter indolifex]